ncbi:MAG: hypothetical protein ABSG19_01035 [Candidatus Aminicenantales bacterium]
MNIPAALRKCRKAMPGLILVLAILHSHGVFAQSLDIPTGKWGISFGNSKDFTGLRFNFRDSRVSRVTGINVTLWNPRKDNKDSVIKGISLGLIPGGGEMTGLQLGLLGPGAEKSMTGVNIGLIGAGSGEDMTGINIGGVGVGAGNNMTGLNIGGIGVGSGKILKGITIAGIGAGAGEKLLGLIVTGVGAGAPEVRGIAVSGAVVGARHLTGAFFAGGVVFIDRSGSLSGLAASPVNYVRGTVNGLCIGIVNYAWKLEKGLQIGIVNIIRDNPKGLKVLPVFNTRFN